ncbi:MAG TPA: AAA family ATPase [Steroidobacteraceae bacterium]|nr:AAA family ATPase [Steroidobacteraceae bacterium]
MDLLEREDVLGELAGWLAEVPRGGGRVVLVGAEAGLGKTVLLQEFARRHPRARFLWGACDALFTPRPLAPVLDVARQAEGPLLQAIRARADRDEIFDAALSEMERRPAVLVFEDLHWADEATLDFVKLLGRRVAGTRALVVLTYRDDEVRAGSPLQTVLGDLPRATTRRVTLTPLSAEAIAALAGTAGPAVQELHRVTGGNPLFVTEVLAAPGTTVPGTIREAVLARAARLTSGGRRIAELVSVVPAAAEGWLVEALLHPTADAVDDCLRVGMVRHSDGSMAYRHELVRRAMEASLPGGRLRELHAAVLVALATRNDVAPARLAHHAAGAEDGPAVRKYAIEAAAQAAAVGAHREAASHYAAALKQVGADDIVARGDLQEKLSYEYYLTDQIALALEHRRAALDAWTVLDQPLRRGDAQRWLSRLSWFLGRRADAEHYSRDAIVTLEALPVGRELALAYSNQAQLDMLAFHADAAVAWATRAIELAQAMHDEEVLCHALNNRGAALLFGRAGEGLNDLERSLRIALEHNFQEHAARAYTNLASTAVSVRQYETGRRYLAEGIAYCEPRDLDSWRLYMLAWQARERFECGAWLEAAEAAEAVLAETASPIVRLPALTSLAHLRLRRGDSDVEAPLAEARALAATASEIQRTAPLLAALAERAWLAGELEALVPELRHGFELACAQRNPWITGDVAAWLWRVGALPAASMPVAEPYALELAGRWRDAAGSWRRLGCPYEAAWVLAVYGDEDALRAALAEFDRMGAAPAAQFTRRRMRASGVRRVPRGSRATTLGNPYRLTRREAQVLELMCSGLRNAAIAKRLFLSTRTVDHHVSAVLTKLGVATRVEAIAIAGRATPPSAS